MSTTRILFCNCTYAQIIPRPVKAEVLRRLVESGTAFDAVADLCESSARHDPELGRLAGGGGELRVAACFPRAVRWLFHAAGAPLPPERVEIFNMRNEDAEAVTRGLLEGRGDAGVDATYATYGDFPRPSTTEEAS